MKFRVWLSIITLILIGLVVLLAWPDIVAAFHYFDQVNLWVLALMIPVQILAYVAAGEVIFSYLRSKGNIKDVKIMRIARMTFEFNFVNHVFPSGGASGVAYLNWLLKKFQVSSARATMAQIIRFGMTFLSFILLLVVALIGLVIDHNINRVVLLVSLLLVVLAVGGTIGAVYVISSRTRLASFTGWLSKWLNNIVRRLTRGRRRELIPGDAIQIFFQELHDDYLVLRREKTLLLKPFLWSIVANALDALLIFIAFWSFGAPPNIAVVFIGYGLATASSMLMVTPGGVGVYEAVMVSFFAATGAIAADVAIAGTLLARVILLAGTIVFGYMFYQLTIIKYGKSPIQR